MDEIRSRFVDDEEYYKQIKTKDGFDGNFLQYGSQGNRNKNLSV